MSQAPGAISFHPATFAWFCVIAAILGALFFRGLVLTGAAARQSRRVIEDGLQIDLLRIERLYPWGRAAVRTSLVWFTTCGATLLLFVSTGFTLFTVATLGGCLAIGLWVFVAAMSHMHHQIRAAKATELEGLRTEIAATKARLESDPSASPRLQSLLGL